MTGVLGWSSQDAHGIAAEQKPEPSGVQAGLLAGTRVATSHGWRSVQALCAGDRLVTFDGGLQPLSGVSRHALWTGESACPPQFWPLEVQRGVLGNRAPLRIMPRQVVMIESDLAEARWGDPFVLLAGEALEVAPGVVRVSPDPAAEVIVLHFEKEQVVFGENGLMALCPAFCDLLDYGKERAGPRYDVLPLAEARALVLAMAGTGASTTPVDAMMPPAPWLRA